MGELTQPPEFHRMQEALFKRIAFCITNPHFQVAERVLFLWNNDYIVQLIKFWPVSLTSKQVLFLNELEETLELTQPPEFHRMQEFLFKRIALCITNPHFQVAERVLFLWNNDYIVQLINQNRQALFPI